MLATFAGFNPKVAYPSLEKEKETFCVVVTYSVKRASEIRKFHVTVVQRQLRNVPKSVAVLLISKPIGFFFAFFATVAVVVA